MRHPSNLLRTLIRVLCFLMVFQGYPAMALQESGRLEPSEPAWTWLDERIVGSLSAAEAAWRSLELDLSWPEWAASVLPAAPAVHFGAGGAGSDEVPPLPPGFRGKKLSPSLRELYAEAGLKSALDAVPLAPGFNLASIPEEPADPEPAQVLAPIAGAYDTVWAYDACDAADPWKLYDPADPAASDLTAIDHEIGFWIDATAPVDLPSDGTLPATTTLQLCTGWNLIGYPLAQPRPVRAALASIEGKYVRVFGFDLGDPIDPWEIFDVAVPDWANDLQLMQPGRGYWVLVTEDVTLTYANTGPPPVVEITSPAGLSVVTGPTEVLGTVESNLLDSWTLRYRPVGTADWTTIATRSVPVSGATLGVFDPTLLLNGLYEIELEAVDFQGAAAAERIAVAVEGDMKIGNFTLSFLDLAVPLSGLDVEVYRRYDSRDKRRGDFGVGWVLDIRQGEYVNNVPPGEGWQILEGFLPCDNVIETAGHLTTVRLSDREVYRFALKLFDAAPTIGGCFARARFDFVGGPLPGSTLEILSNDEVFYENNGNQVIDTDTLELYEPDDVRLTTYDGRIFDLDLDDGVTRFEDQNGNFLTISPTEIRHSSGTGIAIERDAQGRVERIVDPAGGDLVYTYGGAGDLVSVRDRAGGLSRFAYDGEHRLTSLTTPDGNQPVRNEYGADGRLIRTTDALGNAIEFDHDVEGRREVVTDRVGRSRVVEYDERGNVVKETDTDGGVWLRSYDARDNLVSETDPLLVTSTYVYDGFNNLTSATEPGEGTTLYTYDGSGRLLTSTDGNGHVTTRAYDAAGNLTTYTRGAATTTLTYDAAGNIETVTDPEGGVTEYQYDAAGNVVTLIDELGNVTAQTYDANGNAVTLTRTRTTPAGPQTETTSFTYNANGRLTQTDHPDGRTTRVEYDSLGRRSRTIDALGRATSVVYDALGNVTKTTYPDGTTEESTYNAEGELLASKDREGRTTTFVRDAKGRAVETRFPDNSVVLDSYDLRGRLISTTDARTNTTTFEYDDAGRRTTTTDALSGETLFEYGPRGNRTALTDPLGRRTTFEYDAFDRLTKTTFPDTTTRLAAYDKAGRKVSETDQEGKTTTFGYDAAGNLVSVTDALDLVTRFAYDEVGNRISQTDADGRVTRFEYDAAGNRVRKVLPDGKSVTSAYDAAGNVTRRTDFDGQVTTFEYDLDDRLTRRIRPEGAETFSYSATGNRLQATGPRGTTFYSYTVRDRLETVTYPDGRMLAYLYDANGNRTAMTAHVGTAALTTAMTYDALDRLATVTDPDGREYVHGYDANGNRTSLAYPNQVETTYTYDDLNRLTDLTTRTGVGDVVQSYVYTLAADGKRTGIDEHDGTTRDYAYDVLDRLIEETVTGGPLPAYQNTFTYDDVGNRTRLDQGDGMTVSSTTSYSYDTRDRLTTAGADVYTWDDNGRLTDRTGAQAASFVWDSAHRLTSVNLPDGSTVAYTYDVDGHLVRRAFTPSTGPAEVTNFLVDPGRRPGSVTEFANGPLSQVVAEYDDAGNVSSYYVRGDDLLAVLRPADVRYYHQDGLGSVRVLTDDSGVATDRYSYSAFGELLDHTGADPNLFLFAGEALDPNSGFYHLRARWLDPSVGRFTSMDPFAGLARDPMSLHRYLYVNNDPVDLTDPSGLSFFANISVTTLIIGALNAISGAMIADSVFQPETTLGKVLAWGGGGVAGAVGGAYVGKAISFVFTNAQLVTRFLGFAKLVQRLRGSADAGKGLLWLGRFPKGGLAKLQEQAARFGGRVLDEPIANYAWKVKSLEVMYEAETIVFNLSRLCCFNGASWEFMQIIARKEFWSKTLFTIF